MILNKDFDIIVMFNAMCLCPSSVLSSTFKAFIWSNQIVTFSTHAVKAKDSHDTIYTVFFIECEWSQCYVVFVNFHMKLISQVLCSTPPNPAPSFHAILTAKLYSDIKPDDTSVKGTKRGKGKKKRPVVDSLEKKKPKLDELKVLT